MPMQRIDPESLTPRQKALIIGQCNFIFLCILTLIAFVCGLVATGYCNFVNRNVNILVDNQDPCASGGAWEGNPFCSTLFQDHGVGFYGFQAKDSNGDTQCFSYTQPVIGTNGAVWVTPDFDTKFNSARAFTYVANIFGGIAFFTLWLASCCPISQSRLKCLSFHFFIATLFQGLTLLIFQSNVCKPGFFSVYFPPNIDTGNVTSEVSCSLSTGTNLAIVATTFYFWGMLTVPKAIAPSPIGMREMQEIQQQTQLQAQEGGAAEEQPAEDKPAGDDNA